MNVSVLSITMADDNVQHKTDPDHPLDQNCDQCSGGELYQDMITNNNVSLTPLRSIKIWRSPHQHYLKYFHTCILQLKYFETFLYVNTSVLHRGPTFETWIAIEYYFRAAIGLGCGI